MDTASMTEWLRIMACEVKPDLVSQLCHSPAKGCGMFLSHSFLLCKMGMRMPTWWAYSENQRRYCTSHAAFAQYSVYCHHCQQFYYNYHHHRSYWQVGGHPDRHFIFMLSSIMSLLWNLKD